MEIIKRGIAPNEEKFKVTCFCKSVLRVSRDDAIAARGLINGKLIFQCPVCKIRFEIDGVYEK